MCRETKTAGFCAGQNAGVMGCHFGSRNPTHLQDESFLPLTHPPFWVRNVLRSKETEHFGCCSCHLYQLQNSMTQQLRQSNTTPKRQRRLQLWGWDGWNLYSHITLHVSLEKNKVIWFDLGQEDAHVMWSPKWKDQWRLSAPSTPTKYLYYLSGETHQAQRGRLRECASADLRNGTFAVVLICFDRS